MDALFAKGARERFPDAHCHEKARPGTRVSVLVDEQRLDAVLDELFTGSTTIGVRIHEVGKRMLPREERLIDTTLGSVRVKVVTLPSGATRWKSEHDDVAAIAARIGIDYLTAKASVDREIDRVLSR